MTTRIFFFTLVLALVGCSGGDDDDDDDGVDAPGSTSDGGGGADAAGMCLPSEPIPCVDTSECEAMCPGTYCHTFGMVDPPDVCTQSCATGDECPAGWTCNMMGRCRPPG